MRTIIRQMAGTMLAVLATSPAIAGATAPTTSTAAISTGETVTYTYAPEGRGPHPTILFLQGYPCRTAAPEDAINLARNRLIADFVAAGYLVHIAEKPGMADDAQSSKACKDLLYREEVAAFAQVLDQLRADPRVDSVNLYLFGHSMGGQTAPLIAEGRDIKGIVTFGIHAKPWFEFMIDIAREQAERLGIDPVVANREAATLIPFLYDLMIAKKDWAYLEANHQDALAIGVFRADGEYLNGRHYTFWADLNEAPFVDAWAAYEGEVLALYGEYDIASISSEGADRIAAIVNRHHPGQAEARVVPRTGHGFASIEGSFEDYLALRMSGEWTGEPEASLFNAELSEQVMAWMDQR